MTPVRRWYSVGYLRYEIEAMRLEAWAGSNVGLVRKSNQDAVGCFPELCVFVVADGMGGYEGGEVASALAVEAIHELVRRTAGDAAPPQPLRLWMRRGRPCRWCASRL